MTTDSSQGGLFIIIDAEGRHILASPALHAFTGQPADSIVSATWPRLMHADDFDHARDLYRRAFREQRSFAGWWRLRRHDGAFVWAMFGGTPITSEFSVAVIGYTIAVDPLSQPDAFPRAGGVLGPERLDQSDPQSRLARIERLADMALMASALARETGEAAIAEAFDAPLEQIGFRLARLTEPLPPPPREAVTMSEGYRRSPRQPRASRRRLGSRG